MNDTQQPSTQLFAGMQPPGPPPGLRPDVLASATAALEEEPPMDRWAQLWHSRPLRLAWAATVLALVGANLAITEAPAPSSARAAGSFLRSLAEADAEVAEIARLPRLQLDARSLAAALLGSPSRAGRQATAALGLTDHKETKS